MQNRLSIIIPAYNEEDSLKEYLPVVIDFCKENHFHLIIVNDGSKDNTKKVCEQFLESDFFTLLNHKVNRGYGGAIKSGVLAAKTRYVITIDADGQHELSDVSKMLDCIITNDADMIVGSRKNQKNASIYRGIGKFLIRTFARFLMKIPIYDINSGMKIYNTSLGKKYLHLCPDGMAYSDTILLTFLNFRHLVLEEDISINKRISGESTIGTMTAVSTVREILNMVILFNPMKVFLPVSIFILIVSIAWGIPIVFRGDGVSVGTMLGIITSLVLFFIGLIAEQISQIRKKLL